MYVNASDFYSVIPGSTLRRWLKRGLVPGYKINGHWVVYPHDVVDYVTYATLYRACRARRAVFVVAMVRDSAGPALGWAVYEVVPPSASFRDTVYRLDAGGGRLVAQCALMRALERQGLLDSGNRRYIVVLPTLQAAERAGDLLWRRYVAHDISYRFWQW